MSREGGPKQAGARTLEAWPLALAALLAAGLFGCALSHERDARAGAPDASAPSCAPNGVELRVTVEAERPGSPCEEGAFLGYAGSYAEEGEALIMDLRVCPEEGCGCRIRLSGLSAPAREGLLGTLAVVYDGWFELDRESLVVRNTSLCDGPDPWECPLVIEARTGTVRPGAGWGRVSVSWGAQRCEASCGGLRELDFVLDLGERADRASLGQGEIGGVGGTRFANLSSFNTCTDEPSRVTWAHWLER